MASNQLKQSLWFMREILQSGARGISREELCSKWAVSSMNDYPGEEISERTFHRLRRLLEDAFQVAIECSKDGNRTVSRRPYSRPPVTSRPCVNAGERNC